MGEPYRFRTPLPPQPFHLQSLSLSYTYANILSCFFLPRSTHTHTHTYTHTHARTHARTHTHTHMMAKYDHLCVVSLFARGLTFQGTKLSNLTGNGMTLVFSLGPVYLCPVDSLSPSVFVSASLYRVIVLLSVA